MYNQIRQKLVELGVKYNTKLGIAVSGGVDSMVLLHCLNKMRKNMGLDLVAFHLEHGIRGNRSKDDMTFVQNECEKLEIACITKSVDVPALSKNKALSIETAARIARYEFLDAQEADFIATAHHMDDVAETVIMNIARGSGLAGLCGIPEKRGKYIRPMLSISQTDIEEYAAAKGVSFVKDETNDDISYTRNLIRLRIMPLLKKVNQKAAQHIANTSSILANDEYALDCFTLQAGGINKELKGASVSLDVFLSQLPAIQIRMLRSVFSSYFKLYDISSVHLNAIADLARHGQNGKRLDIGNGIIAAKAYDRILFTKTPTPKDAILNFRGAGEYAFYNINISCTEYKGNPVYAPNVEYFNANAVSGSCFRFRKPGDFIRPLGMQGKKRLSDYLSDRKVALHERDSLVLLAKCEEVFWVVGVGVSDTSKAKNNLLLYKMALGEDANA